MIVSIPAAAARSGGRVCDIAAHGFAAEIANEPLPGRLSAPVPRTLWPARRQSFDDVTADEPGRAGHQRFHSDPSRSSLRYESAVHRRIVREVIGTSARIEWKWSPNQPVG